MTFPPEFILFALALIGIAIFHRHTLTIALGALAIALAFKTATGHAVLPHLRSEALLVLNLFGLLLGFSVLERHFTASGLPAWLPRLLPGGWKGPFLLLALVFLLSTFLDNIAAALVGGAVAASVFGGRVRVGYLAALVAASNAGGAGSVLGDTTTTMLWIAGVPASHVAHAFVGSVASLLICGIPASLAQQRHQPIRAESMAGARPDPRKLSAVALVLAGAVAANLAWDFPAAGVWIALLIAVPWAGFPRQALPSAARAALFLCSLVLLASLMPVERLPAASWPSTLALGGVSAAFDNIPLTRLALAQGGYDWGLLAYAVGYGGSMLWFGSSAGVALSADFPGMRSIGAWLKEGWMVIPAYVCGFFLQLWVFGWG